ncbi:hypothetical protein PLICRDRAFT_157569 [Plicaturopsis crispa FD-325 SS-3]|nr:hypothetical protein PLICRDRAFT_157569 [Plicaturopsis crispa FD-325 SS-3]
MRPPSPSLAEREFVVAALRETRRLDGREPLESRSTTLTFGKELGSVECALGKTRVSANVQATMVKPPPERPFEGLVSILAEISPMASPEYESGRASENEVSLVRTLDKVVRRSDAIDKESLCIVAGQRVWHLRLTVHCLSDSGNLADCACLAAVVALRHFRRPDVEVVGDEVTVHDPTERAPVPLAMHHTPYTSTFAFYPTINAYPSSLPDPTDPKNTSTLILLDPAPLELRMATAVLTLALTPAREIVTLQVGGGGTGRQDVLDAIKIAAGRVWDMDKFVETRLAEDWSGRTVEVR